MIAVFIYLCWLEFVVVRFGIWVTNTQYTKTLFFKILQ